MKIIVLFDNDTWATVEGCSIVEIPDDEIKLLEESDKIPWEKMTIISRTFLTNDSEIKGE
jgi:hypothetical protein